MQRPHHFTVDPAWRPLLKDLGVRPADVLRRAGLPEDLLSRAEATLSPPEYFRLWESLAAEVGDPLFPLRLAEAVTADAFSPSMFAALCSPNLRVAVQRLGRYKRLCAPVTLDVVFDDQTLSAAYRWLDPSLQTPRSMAVAELAFLVRLARLATREPFPPARVILREPPEAPEYTRFFGVAIEAGPDNRVIFHRADAERPFLTANDAMWRSFEPELRRRLDQLEAGATVTERVRASLLQALPSGQASMDEVARRLAMSRRTLQRRLRDEHTSFQELLGQTREALARHYLSRTALSAPEIAFLLGYDDPNSFFRAFRDWTGTTPESLRREALH